jgi:hypothetical protein
MKATQAGTGDVESKDSSKLYGEGASGHPEDKEDDMSKDGQREIKEGDPHCCRSCCHSCCKFCVKFPKILADIAYISYLVNLGMYLHEIAKSGVKGAVWTYNPFWEGSGNDAANVGSKVSSKLYGEGARGDPEDQAVQEKQSCCGDYCAKFTHILFFSFFLSVHKGEGQPKDALEKEEQAQLAKFDSGRTGPDLKKRKFTVRI